MIHYLCAVERKDIIAAFAQLGKLVASLAEDRPWSDYRLGVSQAEYEHIQTVLNKQPQHNGWFTKESLRFTLRTWAKALNEAEMEAWLQPYTFAEQPKRIGLILAGNIPMVGFHDLVSVLVSGHFAVVKPSSDDRFLIPLWIDLLIQWQPELKDRIVITPGKLGEVDAMIATGSNNSLRYFEQYFGHLPHIFRHNRTSIAVLDGTETNEEIAALGKDIFTYFGLGCRNVSQLWVPTDFELNRFFEGIYPFSEIIHHHKYANNYDYNKAIHLMNQHDLLENGFLLLKESRDLHAPLAMLFYQRYESITEVEHFIREKEHEIQAVVGHGYVPFGAAQIPAWNDYADHIDTVAWLNSLA